MVVSYEYMGACTYHIINFCPILYPPALRNQDNHGPEPPTFLKWLRNMWTETATFYVYDATKNYQKILDLGPYKESGVGFH